MCIEVAKVTNNFFVVIFILRNFGIQFGNLAIPFQNNYIFKSILFEIGKIHAGLLITFRNFSTYISEEKKNRLS